jgi:hypothetical protein
MGITAKSVIFDIADNYGSSDWLGLRSVEFFLDGTLIGITTQFTAYATTEYNSTFVAENAFDTSLSKTGAGQYNEWMTLRYTVANQRIIIVFDTPTEFDLIVVNNSHGSGISTDRGAKNVVITTSQDAITNTTYNATVTTPKVLFDGVFDEHVVSDVEDPKTVYDYVISGVTSIISPSVSIDGAGELPVKGYTDCISPLVSLEGDGILPITGYTDYVSPLVSVEGVGESAITGYTDFISPLVSVDGVGDLPITGYTDFIPLLASVDGVGATSNIGNTDFISPFASVESMGNVYTIGGFGNVITNKVSMTGVGIVDIIGTGTLTQKPCSVTSVGVNAILGAGYVKPKLAKIFGNYSAIGNVEVSSAIDAYGNVSIIGAGTVVTRHAGVTGYGQLSLLATTDYNPDAPTILGTGIIYQTGRGVVAVPLPTVTTYGYLQSTGIGSFNVKPPVIICHANQPDDYTVIRHNREGVCH